MATQTIFKGTKLEANELVRILQSNCTCDLENGTHFVCEGHKAMRDSQAFLDGLLFYRAISECLMKEEFKQR